MIWLPQTTDISTYFAQSLEIRGIESRLYFQNIFILLDALNARISFKHKTIVVSYALC